MLRPLAFALALFALTLAGGRAYAGVDGVDGPSGHLWTQIKEDTYSQKDHFSKGVDAMSSTLNEEIGELKAKRAAMTSDTSEWDFSMKEVGSCRDLLTDRIGMLARATTPETWAEAKDKIGEAWHGAMLAVDAMNATRTT